VLLSLICILKKKPILSSLSILVATSITPTSLLALMPLCYVMYMKCFTKKHVLSFAAPILLVYAIVMAWDGPRVIDAFANAVYSPTIFVEPFSYAKLLTLLTYQLMRAYGNSFNLICLFAMFGVVFAYYRDKKLWGLMLAFMFPFFAYFLNLGLFSPDHLIISFIAISFLGSYGMLRLLERVHASSKARLILVSLLLCFHVLCTYERSISRQTAYAKELDRVVHDLSKKYHPNGILLSDFDFGVIFFSLLGKDYPYPLLKGNPNEFLTEQTSQGKDAIGMFEGKFWIEFTRLLDVASWPAFQSLVDERPIYFAESKFWPIGMVQLYMPLRDIFGIKDRNDPKRLENIREYLAYKLAANVKVQRIIDSPLYPVYVMQTVTNRQNNW
jgi:uncharacterized membrane protein YqaE (UPF0057 family)